MHYKKINPSNSGLKTTDGFEGMSLEQKVFQAVNSKAPIESVAPMVYTERKDGVLPETNIRTDRFEVAQEAMTDIANGVRERRAKRMLEKTTETTENKADKPSTDSGNKTTQSVQE